jgi:hypothetical protein
MSTLVQQNTPTMASWLPASVAALPCNDITQPTLHGAHQVSEHVVRDLLPELMHSCIELCDVVYCCLVEFCSCPA